MAIYEQRIYVDDAGVTIQRKTPIAFSSIVNGEIVKGDGKDTFFCTGLLNMPLPSGQTAQAQFTCEIPGATPEEAFAAFPEAFEAAKQRAAADLQEQINGPKIIVPGPGGLPSGKTNGHPNRLRFNP